MGRFGLKFRERSVFLGTWKKGYSRTANREVLTLRWWTQKLSYVIDFVLPHCRFFLSTQGVPEIRNNVSQLEGKLIGDWRCSLFKKKDRKKAHLSSKGMQKWRGRTGIGQVCFCASSSPKKQSWTCSFFPLMDPWVPEGLGEVGTVIKGVCFLAREHLAPSWL